jgi:protein tyrosine/serine phosphatase
MCALYRVAVQNWDKKEALREMTEGGFGFHEIWENLLSWFEKLDIKAIRNKAGIKSGTEQMKPPDKK